MIRAGTLALATLTLGGCSILFAPSDLMNAERDAGAGTDGGGTLDAPVTDVAVRPDVPGVDAATDLACPATPQSWALAPADAVGVPSVTFREADVLEARIAFASGGGRASLVEVPLGGPGAGSFGPVGEVADVAGVQAVAVRQIDDVLAWIIISATAGPSGTQVWVRNESDGSALNLSGPNVGQAGPLAITGGDVPKYFWNAVPPERRQIASLRVMGAGMSEYRFYDESLPATPGEMAGSNGDLIAAVQGDARNILLWDGEAVDSTTSGAAYTLTVDTSFVVAPPAIAWRGGNAYVVAAVGMDMSLRLFPVECSLTSSLTTCTEGTVVPASAVPTPIVRMAAVGLGIEGLALVTTDGTNSWLTIFGSDLVPTGTPQELGELLMEGAIDVDAFQVGAEWHIVVAEVEPTPRTLHVTHACITP